MQSVAWGVFWGQSVSARAGKAKREELEAPKKQSAAVTNMAGAAGAAAASEQKEVAQSSAQLIEHLDAGVSPCLR